MVDIITESSQQAMPAADKTGPDERLSSSELANLWSLYLAITLRSCIVEYYLKKVEDMEIRQLLEHSQRAGRERLKWLSELYAGEDHPIPHGFKEDEEVNPDAPRLFTDLLILSHLQDMVKIRIDGYSTAVVMASRHDVSAFLSESLTEEVDLYNRIVSVMKSKGIYSRPPYIPLPEKVDFVTSQSFFRGYLGKRRPLTSIEVSHVFSGLERNAIRKSLFTGFANVATLEDVRKYMERGLEISAKHIEIFSSILIKNDLPVSMSWDSGIVESKVPPFSDRLMMGAIGTTNVELFSTYGKSLSIVGLPELGIDFMRLMAETMKYAKDGIEIVIGHGWLEEPPQVKGKETIDKKLH
ncbi:hypothetical protein DCCM_3016 [Desulfocucumis palustris]|uniref:DUF3231 family protein n=1 Tax=Desulfocucumis palustris TaxID=1898651 RepID=A0A2L2XCE7_9FIRM|nr:DUF3231 family protein [Desulfocucumis palustris]GBF33905.1 hypothetical protein DCCM_3016 [Desulfocucumis palustris]